MRDIAPKFVLIAVPEKVSVQDVFRKISHQKMKRICARVGQRVAEKKGSEQVGMINRAGIHQLWRTREVQRGGLRLLCCPIV